MPACNRIECPLLLGSEFIPILLPEWVRFLQACSQHLVGLDLPFQMRFEEVIAGTLDEVGETSTKLTNGLLLLMREDNACGARWNSNEFLNIFLVKKPHIGTRKNII